MKLHFEFKLVKFRYYKKVNTTVDTANVKTLTVYGSSKELGGNGWFKIHGTEKIRSFNKKIFSNLNKKNPEFLLLYSGKTVFAVATIPSSGDYSMKNLDYLLVHEGTEDMNGFMNLESLNAYMDYWMDKFGPSFLD